MQFWLLPCMEDVEAFQRTQKRFTKVLSGLDGTSYMERFNKLYLFVSILSGVCQRLRRNLIIVYEVVRSIDGIDRIYFPV